MNSFNLLDPEPVTALRTLAAPIFSTNEVAVAPKQPSGAVRRPVGKRNVLSLLGHSSPGDIADDEDEPMSENDGGVGSGDNEEDDENAASRVLKRSRSVDSNATVNPNKKLRISGGRAATHRDVTHILDSDDEIIYSMKRGGRKDETVAQRLIDEGRTKYSVKTIATRYSRILLKMEEHLEQRMEEEFSDFHEQDDIALDESKEELQTWYQRQRDILETKWWREVSKRVNGKLSKDKYSKKACQDRDEARANGTAIVPFEKDSNQNQEARRAQALQQIEKRRADRLAAAEEADRPKRERQRIKDEEDRIKREARAEKEEERAERNAEKATEQAKKDAAKAERERVRAAKLKKEELLKKKKQQELDRKRLTAEESKAAKEKAKEEEKAAKVHAKLLAKLSKAQESAQASKDKVFALASEALATTIMNKGMMEEIKKITTSTSPNTTLSTTPSTNNKKKISTRATITPTAKKPTTPKSKSAKTKANAPSAPSSAVSKTPSKPKSTAAKPKPSTSSLLTTPTNQGSIRATMTVPQLRVLSRNRGLGVSGKKEVLLQNLTRDDSMKSMDALKRLLVERKLNCSGIKQDLIDRIANDDVAKAAGEGKKMTV